MLSFNNSKIVLTGKVYDLRIANFDLPIGFTCPAADLCHSRVVTDENGNRHRVDYGQFPCYKAKSELLYNNVYNKVWSNFEATKESSFVSNMIDEIERYKLTSIRFHSGGDFYNFEYFKKWLSIADALPSVDVWGYTKQATFKQYLDSNPRDNFKMVYSMGGKLDKYALEHDLQSCTVVTDDYTYRTSKTIVTEIRDGLYWYSNPIGKKRGKVIYHDSLSEFYLSDGWYINHLKNNVVERLACLPQNKASDYEYIHSGESFGILFH